MSSTRNRRNQKGIRVLSEFKLDTKFDSEIPFGDIDGFRFGEPGYTEAMESVQNMVDAGYSVVDIMLSIGEKYPRPLATKVLEEARRRGVL